MLSIDAQLNSLLVELNRTMLQYAFECWPYVNDETSAELRRLAVAQQQDVAVLCEILVERQWPIDLGSYPTEYTATQYNSLSGISPMLIESQTFAIEKLQEVAQACENDAFVSSVLAQLLQNEQSILSGLQALGTGE